MTTRSSLTLLALAFVAGTAMVLPTAPVLAKPAPAPAQAEEPKAPKEEAPALKVGDKAPAIQVEKWLQGDAITEFKKGHAYVVEFWATWCGPCVAAMPHMSKMSKQYKDANIHFAGVNVWEQYDEGTLEKVSKFVKEQGPRLTYNVAYDGKDGKMANAYMKAAGQNGIPCAFLVDRDGKIAWIGHPMMLDLPLDMMAKGTWDSVKGPETIAKADKAMEGIFEKAQADDFDGAIAAFDAFAKDYPAVAAGMQDMKLQLLLAGGKETEAYTLMEVVGNEAIAEKDVQKLNMIAWSIVDPESKLKSRNLELATKMIEKANEFSEGKNADVLDTLARVHFTKGDIDKAIEVQTTAIGQAKGRMKAQLEKTLEEYKAAKKG